MDTLVGMSGVEEYDGDSPCSGPAPAQFALALVFYRDGSPGFVWKAAQPAGLDRLQLHPPACQTASNRGEDYRLYSQ